MKKNIYNINFSQIFSGCLFSSIAHAIMTNKYPLLSYEQSWDHDNYSVKNELIEFTIFFNAEYCVGAIRNNKSILAYGEEINRLVDDFPKDSKKFLVEEVLQYLLEYKDNEIVPVISSVFYCDNKRLHFTSVNNSIIDEDIQNFLLYCSPVKKLQDYWKQYYDMTDDNIRLLILLYENKMKSLKNSIHLTQSQKDLIPGDIIREECIESMKELNIYMQ